MDIQIHVQDQDEYNLLLLLMNLLLVNVVMLLLLVQNHKLHQLLFVMMKYLMLMELFLVLKNYFQ